MDIRLSKQSKKLQGKQQVNTKCGLFKLDFFTNTKQYVKRSLSKRNLRQKSQNRSNSGIKLSKQFKNAQSTKLLQVITNKSRKNQSTKNPQKKQQVNNHNKVNHIKNNEILKLKSKIQTKGECHGSFGIPRYYPSSTPIKKLQKNTEQTNSQIQSKTNIKINIIPTQSNTVHTYTHTHTQPSYKLQLYNKNTNNINNININNINNVNNNNNLCNSSKQQLTSTRISYKNQGQQQSWGSTRVCSTYTYNSSNLCPSPTTYNYNNNYNLSNIIITPSQSINIIQKSRKQNYSNFSNISNISNISQPSQYQYNQKYQNNNNNNNNKYKNRLQIPIKNLQQARQVHTVISGDLSHIHSNKDLAISRLEVQDDFNINSNNSNINNNNNNNNYNYNILKESLVIANNADSQDFWK